MRWGGADRQTAEVAGPPDHRNDGEMGGIEETQLQGGGAAGPQTRWGDGWDGQTDSRGGGAARRQTRWGDGWDGQTDSRGERHLWALEDQSRLLRFV